MPEMQFFEHRGVRIAEALEPIMEAYLARLFYYARIFEMLKNLYPDASLHIPVPDVNTNPDAPCLTYFVSRAIVDAAQMMKVVNGPFLLPSSPACLFPKHGWKTRLISA